MMASTLARKEALSGCGACARTEAALSKIADSSDTVPAIFCGLIFCMRFAPIVFVDFYVWEDIRIPICLAHDHADYGLRSWSGKNVNGMKPHLNEPRPMRYGKVRGAQAVAVAALREKGELGGGHCSPVRAQIDVRYPCVSA